MRYALIIIAALLMPLFACAAPFTLTIERDHRISLEAFGSPPNRQSSSTPINEKIQGTERSECRPYGRTSAAHALSEVDAVSKTEDALSFTMKVDATANGGEYRTCAYCISGNCVGLFGNYTTGGANANAIARATIKFTSDSDSSHYLISANLLSTGVAPELRFVDALGISKSENSLRQGIVVKGNPGATYYVEATLKAKANNEGGCCNDEQHATTRIDLHVAKAPLLWAKGGDEPYIVGGEQTVDFPQVGALLIDGRLHCTATVIGSSTLLTAAHCLHGYEGQLAKMTFVQGRNILQPDGPATSVTEFVYPKGSPSGFSYNPKTFEDDIGIAYIEKPLNTPILPLHEGKPTWEYIREKQISLTFVGYGYDIVDQQKFGSGIKREASWGISNIENRRVIFSVPGKNTCKGDSGGPAFYKISGRLVQLAVTSGGDTDCTRGFETRVDAFKPWLSGRVR